LYRGAVATTEVPPRPPEGPYDVMADESAPRRRPEARWRGRILPRSVLGISVLVLFTALGAAFSGAIFYSYYSYKLTQNERFVTSYGEAFEKAQQTIEAEKELAKKEISDALEPLKQLAEEGGTLATLVEKAGPSVWFLVTRDESGATAVGSAFVVASDAEQSFLLTSYSAVRAATRQPGPGIELRKGDDKIAATLHTWQEERDLALLVIDRGSLPRLKWAEGATKTGERVFALSGIGGAGASITAGAVADIFDGGIQHSAAVGNAFVGGPLLNRDGEVLAMASLAFAPLGFQGGEVTFAVPIRMACEKVLRCPEGGAATPG
jgi:S1-C subfamily serine protease